MLTRNRRVILATVLVCGVTLTACGGGGNQERAASPAAGSGSSAAQSKQGDARPTVKTTTVPGDPCAWIPQAEVEQVVGKLAEPPKQADGCRYTFVASDAMVAKRQKADALQQKINQAFGSAVAPELRGGTANSGTDAGSYAVTLTVDVQGGIESELAGSAVSRQLGLGGGERAAAQTDAVKAVTDWDDARRVPYGFAGRLGHIRITAAGESPDVPREAMQALAERVRDRIPDLPFPVTNPYQVMQSGHNDPCSLLTRAEAEAVLGPLLVEPYRSSSNWPPLAHGQGYACAYFTPGHHVFVLSPTWTGGAESFKLEKGIGGLVSTVAPQDLVVLKGPWDQAHISATTGALLFLKGDRLLEVYYRTSRASRGDAVKLAAAAMQRLAS